MIEKLRKKVYNTFFRDYQQNSNFVQNYADITPDEWKTINDVSKYTLTNSERIVSLIRAVNYLEENAIEGSFVECGVWKGGSIMAALMELNNLRSFNREIYLYDTFEGMSEPSDADESYKGESASLAYNAKTDLWEKIKCYSTLEEVQRNISSIQYPASKIHYVKGKVEDTIPGLRTPEKISLLRLDTDWYESTFHELKHLFPRLTKGGIIIIDDYGHWKGCRKAVDEYLNKNKINLFLSRVDYTCRIGVKI